MQAYTTVGQIKNYIGSGIETQPLVWKRIQLRILHHLNAKGLFMHEMTDDKVLDKEIVLLISQSLDDLGCEKLPDSFLER